MRLAIDVAGLDELDEALKALGTEVSTKIAHEAFRTSAEELQQAWIAGAPRGAEPSVASGRYGRLHQNIRVRKVRPQKQNAVVYAVHTGDAFWSFFLEFGTVLMAARPWARPIVDRMRAALIRTQVVIFNQKIVEFSRKTAEKTKRARRRSIVRAGRDHNSVY